MSSIHLIFKVVNNWNNTNTNYNKLINIKITQNKELNFKIEEILNQKEIKFENKI